MDCVLTKFVIAFAPLFSKAVFQRVKVLLTGAILSPASRTVANALRVTGLAGEKHFQQYHRVLSRASWSCLKTKPKKSSRLCETSVSNRKRRCAEKLILQFQPLLYYVKKFIFFRQ